MVVSSRDSLEPWLPDPGRAEPQAAYVHVPFCRRRCGYCNFTVTAGRDDLHQRYLLALVREVRNSRRGPNLESLFLGGGTPTHWGPSKLLQLLRQLQRDLPVARSAEVTVETNPEDVTADLLAACRQGGVTRISLGVQSFDDAKLRSLERVHERRQSIEAVRAVSAAGFQTAVDLMFAAPGESLEQWRNDLQEALRLRPDHISTYGLTFEKGSAFWGRLHAGRLTTVGEEPELLMYLEARRRLIDAGYEHYEVSNFALPGQRCRHNLAYWQGASYWGFGAGAARFMALERQVNHRSTLQYLRRIEAGRDPTAESECLEPVERRRERLVFGLRMLEGVSWDQVDQEAWQACDPFVSRQVARLEQQGALLREGGRLRLTEAGLVLSDAVASRLLAP